MTTLIDRYRVVKYCDLAQLGMPGYRVGDDGSVWSCLQRRGHGALGTLRIELSDKWKQLKPRLRSDGYLSTVLRHHERVFQVHRLVLLAFVGPCPEGMECCHYDGNRLNNHLSNLRWDSRASNQSDRERHGRVPRGEGHPNAKLTEAMVIAIRAEYATGSISMPELATKYGVRFDTIWRAIRRVGWRHVP